MIASVDHALAGLLAAPPGSGANLILAVGTAAVMGTVLALSYRIALGKDFDRDIAASQIMLAALMAMVMLAVGDNLGRAFGSVGILSVLRFRIKMRSTGDALSLLAAVITGMAAGVGLYRLAIAGGMLLAILTVILAGFFSAPSVEKPAKEPAE
ncbi:MAG: hypothetical protein JWM80_206 [Cyanobacteria bacterium RYN_339]|nr:hypothetical protein [Cyanobacteria bacterium RYN_339]